MAMVNGPNGGASEGAGEGILETDMRCHRLSRSRGQAVVETALLLPILMLLVMRPADLGRDFYYAIAVPNAQQTIQVNIRYSFAPVTPLAGVVGADLVQVVASTTMQVQAQQ